MYKYEIGQPRKPEYKLSLTARNKILHTQITSAELKHQRLLYNNLNSSLDQTAIKKRNIRLASEI